MQKALFLFTHTANSTMSDIICYTQTNICVSNQQHIQPKTKQNGNATIIITKKLNDST